MAWWFVSIVTSAVGAGLFLYGKKESRWPQLVVGVLLLFYPYFIQDVRLIAGIGIGLVGALWLLLRLGY